MQHALYADTTIPTGLVQQLAPVLETKLVDYFLTYQQNDSTEYYLAKLTASPGVFTDHDFTLNRFEAELLANQGKYRLAFEGPKPAELHIEFNHTLPIKEIE